jgi:hypothetical protein
LISVLDDSILLGRIRSRELALHSQRGAVLLEVAGQEFSPPIGMEGEQWLAGLALRCGLDALDGSGRSVLAGQQG